MHENLNSALSQLSRLPCLGCITIERSGIIERHTHRGFLTFRADESVDQGAEPFKRWFLDVLEYAAQQLGRLPPFVTL